VTSQDRCSREPLGAVEYRARHLAERRVPRLDVVVVRLDAVEVRTHVLPQPVPEVHGVVAAPVEPRGAPDQLQFVEVRPIDSVLVHVHQVRKTPRQVERHLRRRSERRRRLQTQPPTLRGTDIFNRCAVMFRGWGVRARVAHSTCG